MSAPETTQKPTAKGRIFRDLKAVRAYLVDELGLKVSLPTLYRRSQEGVLFVDENGLWSTDGVDALAARLAPALREQADGGALPPSAPRAKSKAKARERGYAQPIPEGASLPELKMAEEVRKLRAQIAGIEHENAVKAGKYFRKADVWLELAARASVLEMGLAQSLRAAIPDIVRAAIEDPAKAEEAAMQALDRALAQAINTFSKPMTLDVETWTQEISDDDIPGRG